jgi:hypothetical protein
MLPWGPQSCPVAILACGVSSKMAVAILVFGAQFVQSLVFPCAWGRVGHGTSLSSTLATSNDGGGPVLVNPRGVPEIVCGLPLHPRLVYAGPMQVSPDDILSTGLLQQCHAITGFPLCWGGGGHGRSLSSACASANDGGSPVFVNPSGVPEISCKPCLMRFKPLAAGSPLGLFLHGSARSLTRFSE